MIILSKPFIQLLARLNAIFRRMQVTPQEGELETTSIAIRNVEIWPERRHVHLSGIPLSLTGMEFDILNILMTRSGRVVTRDAMMNALKGEDWDVYDRSIDVHISHIRKKMDDSNFIKTIRGVGYMVTP